MMISRKRTFDGDSTTFREVYVPFKQRIPLGRSEFTVKVPQIYTDRRFFFSSLVLMPDFYSKEAQAENTEDQEVLDTPIDYEVFYKIIFETTPPFYPDTFTLVPREITTTVQLVEAINSFFEIHKPAVATRLGMFFDWIDLRFDGNPLSGWDNWVQNVMALAYYGEDYDPAKHYNALPLSARSVIGVNNYLIPTNLTGENLQHLRFRLILAPNTTGAFSTGGPLRDMGFTQTQLGQRGKLNKLRIVNEENATFHFLLANKSFVENLDKTSTFKVDLEITTTDYVSNNSIVSVTKGDSVKNVSYEKALKKVLEVFSYDSNIKIDMSYSEAEKTFSFTFPQDRAIRRATIVVPTDLSERLGFELVNDITNNNKKGQPVSEDVDVKNTEAKARALGYDTGVVVVSNANIRSNTTAGINEEFMCSLYPTATGTFEIPHLESCFKPATTQLPHFYTSSTGTVPAHFKLSRFLDNDDLVHLDWKNGAFVSGLLRGSKPKTE
jgi:hypothetical protein